MKIRNYQVLLADPVFRRDGVARNRVKELIEKRKKYLAEIRNKDYKKFEWLLEVLSILYQPFPE